MEVVGEYLGFNKDTRIWKHFKNNHRDLFPMIGSRCNFVKQAANLWHVKQLIHLRLSEYYSVYNDIHVIDGFTVPICHYIRSSKCKSFKGLASYGYCAAKDEKYYGFKGHMIIDSNGFISSFTLAVPEEDERVAMLDICGNIKGLLIGDKGYISYEKSKELCKYGIDIQIPKRCNMKENRPGWFLKFISSKRKIIETVASLLCSIFNIQSIRVREMRHLINKIVRKILAHNICTFINMKYGLNILDIEPIVN